MGDITDIRQRTGDIRSNGYMYVFDNFIALYSIYKTNIVNKNKLKILIQAACLCLFCFMAAASASSQHSSGSGTDWGSIGRSAIIGAGAGHDGYDYIGTASSESEAKRMAANRGYSRYLWDTNSGNVYAK